MSPSEAVIELKATLSGPFFQRNPGQTVKQNIHTMMLNLAREGQEAVRTEIPSRSGDTAAGVIGRAASVSGKPWMLYAVISQQRAFPWAQRGQRGSQAGSSAVYRGGRLEAQQHQFRHVTSALRSSKAVLSANLTQGLE